MHLLETAISQWDKKQAAYISSVYKKFGADKEFPDHLLSICVKNPALDRGTTWLLKHHLDEGGILTEALLTRLGDLLPVLNHWEARLHVLQVFSVAEIPPGIADSLYVFAKLNSLNEKNFVRAWAYQVMYKVSLIQPGYRAQLLAESRVAAEKEMASVRSKLKKIIAGLEKKLK